MRSIFLFAFFVLCSVHHGVVAMEDPVPDPRNEQGCWVMNTLNTPQSVIRCNKLGIDDRSFEEVIGDGSILYYEYAPSHTANGTLVPFKGFFRNVSVSEIADLVTNIELIGSHNVTLGENALNCFVNLTVLQISAPTVGDGEGGRLNLAPGVFRQLFQLTQLEIFRMTISDESIPALLELKDRLQAITITDVSPEDNVFAALGQFTKLKYMGFFNCTSSQSPISTVKGSAAALETFEVQNCKFPKLAKDVFAKSPKLRSVNIQRSNLSEVESGALDQNPLLNIVNLRENDLPSLPDGLFSKQTKLTSVILDWNPRLRGSIDRSNFTHVEERHFWLGLP